MYKNEGTAFRTECAVAVLSNPYVRIFLTDGKPTLVTRQYYCCRKSQASSYYKTISRCNNVRHPIDYKQVLLFLNNGYTYIDVQL